MEQSVIDRFRKIQAYAQRGEGNERANAEKLLNAMRKKHPGIDEAVAQKEAFERPGAFVVPEGPPPPGFWEAAFDAAGLMMGRTRPEDLFFKYMDALEYATAPVPGGTELVELTDEEAQRLVVQALTPKGGFTPLNGLRMRVDSNGNAGGLLQAYAANDHNKRLIAKHFGQMMAGLMYRMLSRR